MKNKILEWGRLTNSITEDWIREYFEIEEREEIYFDWVAIGEVFQFSDYWFSFADILECYRLNVSKEQLFSWYDSTLLQEIDLSLCDFILSPQKREEVRVKHLAELEERVKVSKEELEKALDEYSKKEIQNTTLLSESYNNTNR